MTVAAVAARLTVLCSDCLSVATRGTETCAVPTVSDDGIELVMLVKPSFEGQVLAGPCTQEPRQKNEESNSHVGSLNDQHCSAYLVLCRDK